MNFHDRIVSQNIARCEAREKMLTEAENRYIKKLKLIGVNNQTDFNALARIADDGEKRKQNAGAVPEHAEKCPVCGKAILWISTKNNKKILIDAATYHDEPYYNPTKNACHWTVCDYRCP